MEFLHISIAIKELIFVALLFRSFVNYWESRLPKPPYHPEGNGQVERFNRTLEDMLAKTIGEGNQQNWDIYLPKALLAYRTSLHEVTGFTPYHLVFGHSPQLPIDVMLGRITNTKVKSFPQFVQ